jgi:hypothetical protein
MDKELIDYIIDHYSGLLSTKEKAAQKHYHATLKTDNISDSPLREMMLRQWGTKDKETLDLLDNGYEEFKRLSANKILREHKDKIFVNNCPKCGRLARTPLSKQCRHCRHDWH